MKTKSIPCDLPEERTHHHEIQKAMALVDEWLLFQKVEERLQLLLGVTCLKNDARWLVQDIPFSLDPRKSECILVLFHGPVMRHAKSRHVS